MSFNIFFITVEIFIAVTASVSNFFVIVVFLRTQGFKQRSYYFILYLAIADFVTGCFVIPFSLSVSVTGVVPISDLSKFMNSYMQINQGLVTKHYTCITGLSSILSAFTVSKLLIVCISYDRFRVSFLKVLAQ